jgi:hypothetical protein
MNGRRVLIVVFSILFVSACAPPPKILIRNEFGKFARENKTVKLFIVPAGTLQKPGGEEEEKKGIYHLFIRVCDLDNENKEVNCKDSLILKNILYDFDFVDCLKRSTCDKYYMEE